MRSIAVAVLAVAVSCAGGQKTDSDADGAGNGNGATNAPLTDAQKKELAEKRHAERTERAVHALCSLATRCAVLHGEAMGDKLSEEERAAFADPRVLEANTQNCVDEQLRKSELSPRQVGVIEQCSGQYSEGLTLEQCDPLFECVNKASK